VSTSSPTSRVRLYAGVDIAAETFTAAWMAPSPNATPGRAATFDQTPQGVARLQERLRASGQQPADILVVMEATGSYWIALATTLAQAGFMVSVVNPAQAHHVAKALLLSITGIGLVTAAWLLVSTLHVTVCATAEEATTYAGLAPHPRESGTSVRGRAVISGGHKRLRTALSMATRSAGQHNPVIRDFYRRLRAAGKPKKVARCAAARTLRHLAGAVVRTGQAFDPLHAHRQPVAA